MSQANSDRGRQNELRGRQTEAMVAAYHVAARQYERADLFKVPTPTKPGHDGKLIFTRKSTVDFVGVMLDGTARFIAEEVKSFYDQQVFYLSQVDDHQRRYLDKIHAAGGVSILTIVDKLAQIHVCDWSGVREMTSLDWDYLRERRVRPPEYLKRFVQVTRRPGSET